MLLKNNVENKIKLDNFRYIKTKDELMDFIYSLRDFTLGYIEEITTFSKKNWLISQINDYMVYKGKMVRSTFFYILVLGMVNKLDNIDEDFWDKIFRLGAIFELVHSATLVHDDILDSAEIRRGKPAVHRKFGIDGAMIFGDILIISVLDEAYNVFPMYSKILMESLKEMCLGEVLQYQNKYNMSLSEEEYFRILYLKTGTLFGAISKIAYHFASSHKNENYSEEYANILYNLFSNCGVSFQIVDDVLDYFQDPKVLKKDSYSDVLTGRVTYPLIVLANKSDKNEVNKWKKMWLKNPGYFLKIIRKMVYKYSEIYEESLQKAKSFINLGLLENTLKDISFSEVYIKLIENFVYTFVNRSY